jgi:sugar phosphate permease
MSIQKTVTPTLGAITASKVRYGVLAVVCLLYFLSYLDRVAISVTAPSMMKDFHFNKSTMGLVFSAFAYTYALLQIAGGSLGDRFGPRRVLTFLMALWSAFTIVTGAATNLATLIFARLMFGLGEAGGFPVATRALSTWFPKDMRGFLQGITHACSRSGAAFSAPIVVGIVIWTGNWRYVFYILGALGLVWAVVFYYIYRDSPASMRNVNDLELDYISGQTALARSQEPPGAKIPWGEILRSRDVWLLTFSYFTYGYTLWIYLTWLPSYLTDVRHFSFAQLGLAASLPLAGGVVGDLSGGWLSDTIFRRTGDLNLARRSLIALPFIGTVLFVVPSLFVQNAILSVALSAGALFMLECAVSNCWAVSMDIGGRHFSGTISGVMNTGFGIAGILSPTIFGIIVDRTGSWSWGFWIGSVLLVLGAVAILFVNATKSVGIKPAAA